jgi:hypothetical protein
MRAILLLSARQIVAPLAWCVRAQSQRRDRSKKYNLIEHTIANAFLIACSVKPDFATKNSRK